MFMTPLLYFHTHDKLKHVLKYLNYYRVCLLLMFKGMFPFPLKITKNIFKKKYLTS